MEPEQLALPDADYADLITRLTTLSRSHLLYFRVEVGRTVAEALYGGVMEAYHDQRPNKPNSLHQFATLHRARLADLGLTEPLLRQCVLAWGVVRDLPRSLVQHLLLSHVIELTRVGDPATRLLLAQATVDNGWGSDALGAAVDAVRNNRWIDGNPEEPGLQPPAPEPPAPKPLAPGRVVNRFEKTTEDLGDVLRQWADVPVDKLTKPQQARMRQTIVAAREYLDALEAKLPASP